jgi:hypothetical protein
MAGGLRIVVIAKHELLRVDPGDQPFEFINVLGDQAAVQS